MKRISAVLVSLVCYISLNAQEAVISPAVNLANIQKKLTKSDLDIQDPKKNIVPKTWITRGQIFQSAFDVNNTQLLRKGMPVAEARIYFKEPLQVETMQMENGATREKHAYDNLNLYFENSMLVDWEELKFVTDKPLDKAFDSYLKAREVDAEKKSDKKIKDQMGELRNQFQRDALYNYEKGKFGDAYHAFEMMTKIDAMPFNNTVDTLISYYTGLAAEKAGDPTNTIKHMKTVLDKGMKEHNIYIVMSNAYMALGDTVKAGETLKEGNTKYPDDVLVVIELVNFYLRVGESQQALDYLNLAKKADPTNKTFYFAEGSLYDKMSDFENAKKAYDKALEIDPAYFDATYNYGVLYYNHAVKLYEIANKEMDNKVYLEKKKLADDELMRSLPYMEKAHAVNPNDRSTMETLKTLYYRLQMTDKLDAIKKELGQ